ncbi:hypothetical protein BDF22DRAFT_741279 [Syncephalis plumigaleata]|nr:hypothetical protein BDF22DRAFT_741279 [Syncephalis plumigaleata]
MYYRPDTRTSLWTSKLPVRNLFIILVWAVFGKLCQQSGDVHEHLGELRICSAGQGRFLKLCIQLHRQQGLEPKKSTPLLQSYHCLYGVRWSSHYKSSSNALPFDEQAASQYPGEINSNVQLRPESTDALESIFEVFPDPPFHIGGIAMTRDLVDAYLNKEAEIDQATGFTDQSRLFPLVQSYVTRHVPDSLGGRTKVKDNEDVENHVIMNPADAEAWHCLGIIQLHKKSFHCQVQAARMAALSRQGMQELSPIAKPLNGTSLAPLANKPVPSVKVKSDVVMADWQKTAYQIIIYCLNNALSIDKKNWKLHYLLGKCLEKLRYSPSEIERSLDAQAKLLSYIAKQYLRDTISTSVVERAITTIFTSDVQTELEEHETQLMSQVSNSDNPQKLTVIARITAALMLLKSKDRRRWHHKPIYHLSWLLYTVFNNTEAAITELQSLFYLKSTSKSLSNIWRTEYERPGSHFVYLQKYALFLIDLFNHGNHVSQLISLGRRLRKSTGVFLEPQVIFNSTIQACIEVIIVQ